MFQILISLSNVFVILDHRVTLSMTLLVHVQVIFTFSHQTEHVGKEPWV